MAHICNATCPREATARQFTDDYCYNPDTQNLRVLRCSGCSHFFALKDLTNIAWVANYGMDDGADEIVPGDPIVVNLVVTTTTTLDVMDDVQQIARKLGANGEEHIGVTGRGHTYLTISLERMRQELEIQKMKRPHAV